jgi:hypothetical protein
MLFDLNGKHMTQVPHHDDFERIVKKLGPQRVEELRAHIQKLIDDYPPVAKSTRRMINSSWWGSEMEPWPPPLDHLYLVARELENFTHDETLSSDVEDAVQEKAGMYWGLFLWEAMIQRPERWYFYSSEGVLGKTYIEFEDVTV